MREREVFSCVVGGATKKGIARALVLSENTVEKHVSSILGKSTTAASMVERWLSAGSSGPARSIDRY